MRYKEIEHTADIGIIVYGETQAELFANGLFALFDCMVEIETLPNDISREIALRSDNVETLFRKWLSEFLYIFNTESIALPCVRITHIDGESVSASAQGGRFDPARHMLKTEIKAVTYHQLEVKEEKGAWTAKVIFDV